jgi:ATP-dependent Zn protease
MEIEDRFGHWRSEEVASLIWTLGAMAAEYVFYGQNTTGVGGDLGSATFQASRMVGLCGMGPSPVDFADRIEDPEAREEAEQKVRDRCREIGNQILHRSGGGMMDSQPLAAVIGDRGKRDLVVELLGQCFVVAHATITANRDATESIADRLIEAGELYGDDVENLLNNSGLRKPPVDLLEESTWPAI